ncbi:MAG TPA: hypothetical protein VF595_01120 [Tepidisphaeraceae bacterium]|jgi:hypothetical protein
MLDILTPIATDLTTYLGTLLPTLTNSPVAVSRCYVPVYDVESESGIKVFVIAKGWEETAGSTRDSLASKPSLVVCVMKKITEATQVEEVDAMLELTGDVMQGLQNLAAIGETGAAVTKVYPLPLYDPAQLDTLGLFQSVLHVETKLLQKRNLL